MERFKLVCSKSGLPCLWEQGGGMTNTGSSQVIAGSNGEPKKPIYVKKRGPLACGDHALFVIDIGDIIVKASHHREDFVIDIWQISQIENDEALCNLIYSFDRGEWYDHSAKKAVKNPLDWLLPAVEASKAKAMCYHCREPHLAEIAE